MAQSTPRDQEEPKAADAEVQKPDSKTVEEGTTPVKQPGERRGKKAKDSRA